MDIKTVEKQCDLLAKKANIPTPVVKVVNNNQYNAYSIPGKYLKSKQDEVIVTNYDLQTFSLDKMKVTLAHEIGHLIIGRKHKNLEPCQKAILQISPSSNRSAIIDAIVIFGFMIICVIISLNTLGTSPLSCIMTVIITLILMVFLFHIMALLYDIKYCKWMIKNKQVQKILKMNRKIELKADYYSVQLTNEPKEAINLLKFFEKISRQHKNNGKKHKMMFLKEMVLKKVYRMNEEYHLSDHPSYKVRIKAIQKLERR